MKKCRHPYCIKITRTSFCSDSCRVGYHTNHKERMSMVATILQDAGVKLGHEDLAALIKDVYKAAHGKVEPKGFSLGVGPFLPGVFPEGFPEDVLPP